MSIASNLRREMDEQGVTVASLAAQIQAEPSSVRKYLSGKIRPSERVLARLARCLGTTPEELKYGRPRRASGKLTTDDVARATGIDPLSLRIGLQRGIWPFGTAYKRPGSGKYSYEYDPAGVLKWIADRKAIASGGRHEEPESASGSVGGTAG
jgi:transcriptional regulator with XRE-family HTH domain